VIRTLKKLTGGPAALGSLVAALLFWTLLATPTSAQQTEPATESTRVVSPQDQLKYHQVFRVFLDKLTRLIIATGFSDPALTIQELDNVEPELQELEAILLRLGKESPELEELRNILAMVPAPQ
jgi:hypothetical protein